MLLISTFDFKNWTNACLTTLNYWLHHFTSYWCKWDRMIISCRIPPPPFPVDMYYIPQFPIFRNNALVIWCVKQYSQCPCKSTAGQIYQRSNIILKCCLSKNVTDIFHAFEAYMQPLVDYEWYFVATVSTSCQLYQGCTKRIYKYLSHTCCIKKMSDV